MYHGDVQGQPWRKLNKSYMGTLWTIFCNFYVHLKLFQNKTFLKKIDLVHTCPSVSQGKPRLRLRKSQPSSGRATPTPAPPSLPTELQRRGCWQAFRGRPSGLCLELHEVNVRRVCEMCRNLFLTGHGILKAEFLGLTFRSVTTRVSPSVSSCCHRAQSPTAR